MSSFCVLALHNLWAWLDRVQRIAPGNLKQNIRKLNFCSQETLAAIKLFEKKWWFESIGYLSTFSLFHIFTGNCGEWECRLQCWTGGRQILFVVRAAAAVRKLGNWIFHYSRQLDSWHNTDTESNSADSQAADSRQRYGDMIYRI